jgi:mono/diheme cytochrome c family protein
MQPRTVRLVVVPALLLLSVSGLTFGLAQLHPAKPEASAAASVESGDPVRGEALYAEHCAGCHGEAGRNATVGPDLAGNPISLEDAQTQIETGSGVMPANLVEGQELEDVLAYLETILAGEALRESD